MAGDFVEFRLTDGTSLLVPEAELRHLYEVLWDLSDTPGAVSTAALLMDEARKYARYRHPVELTVAQGNALRQAADLTKIYW